MAKGQVKVLREEQQVARLCGRAFNCGTATHGGKGQLGPKDKMLNERRCWELETVSRKLMKI